MLDIQARLNQKIYQQPHVVQQDAESKVEQPDAEVLRGGPGKKVLDRLLGVLDAPPATVTVDHTAGIQSLYLRVGLHVLVGREGDSLVLVCF
jgi:hypothetical protein